MIFREKQYGAGQVGMGCRFMIYGGEYILAQIDDNVMTLVNVFDGNRWAHSVKVENRSFLSKDEFLSLLNEHPFEKVKMVYCPYN